MTTVEQCPLTFQDIWLLVAMRFFLASCAEQYVNAIHHQKHQSRCLQTDDSRFAHFF